MTFFYPQYLYLLIVPALLLGVEIFRVRHAARKTNGASSDKILRATAGANAVRLANGTSSAVSRLRAIRWWFVLGLVCGVIALARPQWGKIEEPVFDQSREILIAIDLSRSMLAQDVKPSRLERARLLIQNLLDALSGERVGLVVFSGTAFLQAPLSSDYEIFREFLPAINPDYLPEAGTNFSTLLETAKDSYSEGGADRFLIVLSDGEADPADVWRPYAEECKMRGIRVITLGVGTAAGAMIPDGTKGLLKDERGAVVLSRLEPATLQELATLTNGIYADASQWVDIAALIQSTVAQGMKGEFRETSRAKLAERFQWVLGASFFFLLLSLWREFPVRPKPRHIKVGVASTMPVGVFAFILTFLAVASPVCAQEAPSVLEPLSHGINGEAVPSATIDTSSSAAKLSEIVGRLAAQNSISSSDTVALANATLDYAKPLRDQGKPVPSGPVEDALEAVRRAEKKDPTGADWKTIRAQLEALKNKPPEQKKQEQNDQQNKDNKDSSDEKKQDNQQDQKNQQGESSQNKKESEDKNSQEQKNDNQSGQSEKKEQHQAPNSDSKSDSENKQPGGQSDDSEKKSDGTNSAGKKDQQRTPTQKGEKAFENMRDEKKPTAPTVLGKRISSGRQLKKARRLLKICATKKNQRHQSQRSRPKHKKMLPSSPRNVLAVWRRKARHLIKTLIRVCWCRCKNSTA